MWKRGGRSSALERAQALLSAKKRAREQRKDSAEEIAEAQCSIITKAMDPNAETPQSDLSDLSSVSFAPQLGNAAKNHGRDVTSSKLSIKDVSYHNPLKQGTRFLKKLPTPPQRCQLLLSRDQTQHLNTSGPLSPSKYGSQTTVQNGPTDIKRCIPSKKQTEDQSRHFGLQLFSDEPPLAAALPRDTCIQLPPPPNQENNFFRCDSTRTEKSSAAASALHLNSTCSCFSFKADNSSRYLDVGDTEPGKVIQVLSLYSTENNMKTLPEDPRERKIDKVVKSQLKNSPSPHPPFDASFQPVTHHNAGQDSPFKFNDQGHRQFSSTVHTSSPTLYEPSQSRHSPRCTNSTMSDCGVLSLNTVEPVSDSLQSDLDTFSTGADFKIHVMTPDNLTPVSLKIMPELVGKEEREATHFPAVLKFDTKMRVTKPGVEYPSNFESDNSAEPLLSTRLIFEYQPTDSDEQKMVSKVREDDDKATREEHSSHFTEVSHLRALEQSCKSKVYMRTKGSRTVSYSSSQSVSMKVKNPTASVTVKEAAVQTQLEAPGYNTLSCHPSLSNTPMVWGAVNSSKVEASFISEMLQQQFTMLREVIERNHHFHAKLLQSFEPPTHRYTTLKNTKKLSRTHKFQADYEES